VSELVPQAARKEAIEIGGVVDILMPAFNAAKTLSRAVISVANQSSPDWRLQILVDPASKDATLSVANRLKTRINGRIFVNIGQKAGLPVMYREIIDRAEPKDDICGFLDSDDILYPKAVERVLKVYKKKPDAGCVWTQFHFLPQRVRGWSSPLPERRSFKAAFMNEWWGAQHFRTFRKSIYDKATFEIPLNLPFAVDHSLALRLASADPKGYFLNEILYGYYMGLGSISKKHKVAQRRCYKQGLRMFKAHMRKLRAVRGKR